MSSILDIKDFGYAWPDAADWAFSGTHLRISAGECHCLTGSTGSGKSTLALSLKGLLPSGRQSGSITFNTPEAKVGLVMQNPETQLFASTLGEEVAFALENQGVDPRQMPAMVADALQSVGLERSFNSSVETLSMGQKYRVLLASVLVMQPELLILDEPAAQLDSGGINDLRKVLKSLTRQGTALLLCEHRPQAFADLIDSYCTLGTDSRPTSERGLASRCFNAQRNIYESDHSLKTAPAVVSAKGVSAGTDSKRPLWNDASFSFEPGQRVLVQGSNGAGKSTLLRLLAGLENPIKGEIKIFGQKPSAPSLRAQLGFLFQNPQRQLFEDRVIDEVAFSLKRRGVATEERQSKAMDVLQRCGIAELAARSPHKLSFGQKHLVALSSILVCDPKLLLLDDPFAGLDTHFRQTVWKMLLDWSNKFSTTVIWTSHHDDEVPEETDTLLTVTGGQIVCRTLRS